MMAFKQKGATLVVALIILLVMTFLGIATMQSSTLQERMAANARNRVQAQSAAEFALKTAESYLLANLAKTDDVNSKFDGTNGLYAAVARPNDSVAAIPAATDLNKDSAWTASNSVTVNGLTNSSNKAVTAKDPRYVIEYIGRGSVLGGGTKALSLNAGAQQGDVEPFFFRITAIGWAKDEKIYSVLESTFRTGYGTGFVY
ncbi:PilX N-terminal domain-containing pilus assembly protein [Agaribacterium sp. ZY112]|uniref:pilus assembly PilX family protein n=1 Tax=Agaribacterium sp. ZY112 TaxID=3233574 RepID=UPI003526B42A